METESPDQSELLRRARTFLAKKHLGQHFLIDPAYLSLIVKTLNASPGDQILEIGPGLGFLTDMLANLDASLTAVELDLACVGRLNHMHLPNTDIIHGDFLQFDLGQLINSNCSPASAPKLKVIGNVPYQITAPIVRHIFGEIGTPSSWIKSIDCLVMTIQHEVAQRFVATPGGKDYSQITLLVNYYCRPEFITTVPAEAFYPSPEVISAVVKLTPLERPSVDCTNPRLLKQVIHAGFSQRRKMLKNNLSSIISASQISQIFEKLNFDPQTRAERLSLVQFAKLTDAIDAVTQSGSRQ